MKKLLALLSFGFILFGIGAPAWAQWGVGSPTPKGTLVGSWELNGDGVADKVYFSTSLVEVVLSNGTLRSFHMPTTPWSLMFVSDTDGKAGAELVFNVTFSSSSKGIRVIRAASNTVKDYTTPASWTKVGSGVSNLNGAAGNEIMISYPGAGGTILHVIRDANGTTKDYYLPTTWSLFGVAELNGVAGNELVVAYPFTLRIIRDANQTVKDITVPGNWTKLSTGFNELNGVAGSELMIHFNNTIRVYRDNGQTQTDYFLGSGISSWALVSIENVDGYAGNEIVTLANAGAYKYVTIYDRTKSIKTTTTKP